MGFLDGFGRFMQGKPVFETPPVSSQPSSSQANQSQEGTSQPVGPKVIPHVYIEQSETYINGHRMKVIANIKNGSEKNIEVDKIFILGNTRELDTHLRPGEEREIVVYDGEMPKNRNYSKAEVQFKDDTGDYFSAPHLVEYEQEDDGYYKISRFRSGGGVRDI